MNGTSSFQIIVILWFIRTHFDYIDALWWRVGHLCDWNNRIRVQSHAHKGCLQNLCWLVKLSFFIHAIKTKTLIGIVRQLSVSACYSATMTQLAYWSDGPGFEPRSRRNRHNRKRGPIEHSLSLSPGPLSWYDWIIVEKDVKSQVIHTSTVELQWLEHWCSFTTAVSNSWVPSKKIP